MSKKGHIITATVILSFLIAGSVYAGLTIPSEGATAKGMEATQNAEDEAAGSIADAVPTIAEDGTKPVIPQIDFDVIDDQGTVLAYGSEVYFHYLFKQGCKRATAEQLQSLGLREDFDPTYVSYESVRDFMIAFGYLPNDTPRITEAQANAILDEVVSDDPEADVYGDIKDLKDKLNSIAGAPDYSGGSGMLTVRYDLEDTVDGKKKAIVICNDVIVEIVNYTDKCSERGFFWSTKDESEYRAFRDAQKR